MHQDHCWKGRKGEEGGRENSTIEGSTCYKTLENSPESACTAPMSVAGLCLPWEEGKLRIDVVRIAKKEGRKEGRKGMNMV
jgi:hypothetical protein